MAAITFTVSEQLSPDNLVQIQRELGGEPGSWSLDEIGDGNVNLIFRLRGPRGQVLIKQAVPYLRCVGESWPLSLRRNYFELKALEAHAAHAPQHLPRVFGFNEASAAMIMEFFGEHLILRRGVMQGIRYPKLADHITDYMAKTLFFTSDLFLPAASKKQQMQLFCENVDLCKITEDLIFTDPYRPNAEQNRHTTPQLDALAAAFASDAELKVAITEMKESS